MRGAKNRKEHITVHSKVNFFFHLLISIFTWTSERTNDRTNGGAMFIFFLHQNVCMLFVLLAVLGVVVRRPLVTRFRSMSAPNGSANVRLLEGRILIKCCQLDLVFSFFFSLLLSLDVLRLHSPVCQNVYVFRLVYLWAVSFARHHFSFAGLLHILTFQFAGSAIWHMTNIRSYSILCLFAEWMPAHTPTHRTAYKR